MTAPLEVSDMSETSIADRSAARVATVRKSVLPRSTTSSPSAPPLAFKSGTEKFAAMWVPFGFPSALPVSETSPERRIGRYSPRSAHSVVRSARPLNWTAPVGAASPSPMSSCPVAASLTKEAVTSRCSILTRL